MDREVARLQQTEGGEFDVKRESNLREKLNSIIATKKELEATIAKLVTTQALCLLDRLLQVISFDRLKRRRRARETWEKMIRWILSEAVNSWHS